jgi:hypothetical protein
MLLTLLIVGATGAVAGFGTYSVFSSTTSNAANQAGTGDLGLAARGYAAAAARAGSALRRKRPV